MIDKAEIKKDLNSILEFFKQELSKLRTGRATTSLIEDVEVEVYGSKMKIKELGSLTIPEPQQILVTPWDKSLIPAIAKAVNGSDLGLNSSYDQDKVRVPIPPLSQERRTELAKGVTSKLESAKTSVRDLRNKLNKDIDNDFTEKNISEDDKFKLKAEVDKIMKDFSSEIEKIAEEKKESILSI